MFFEEDDVFEGLSSISVRDRRVEATPCEQITPSPVHCSPPAPVAAAATVSITSDKKKTASDKSSAASPPSEITTLPEVDLLKSADERIQEGLSILAEGVTERTNLIKENFQKNSNFSDKDEKFAGINKHVAKLSSSALGNQIYRVAKRAEVDSAIAELDIKNRCFLVFNEEECIKFVDKHMRILLQMAFRAFSRNTTIRSKKIKTNIVKVVQGATKKSNKMTIVTKDTNDKTCLVGRNGFVVNDTNCDGVTTVREIDVRGVDPSSITKLLSSCLEDAGDDDESNVRPEERVALDLELSGASHVFSTLKRLDKNKPVYYCLGTLWQKHYHPTNPKKFRMVEVVGWEENKETKKAVIAAATATGKTSSSGIGHNQNIIFLPGSFKELASRLLNDYRSILVKNARDRKRPKELKERVINPEKETFQEHEEVMGVINRSLDIMLSMAPESAFKGTTETSYRRRYKRYTLFCMAMYMINRKNHGSAVSPLAYNFFNFFSYMYANGPDVYASSYMSIMNFLYIHIFKLVSSAAPAVSVKRLLDIDSTILKGGKAAIRDFSMPVKTSIHTRTAVSFLGYAENLIRLNVYILKNMGVDPNNKHLERVALSLERWCDAVLFFYFSFVLFHRFSMIKKINLDECVRLVMGQAHLHFNKAKASKLVRMANAGSIFAKNEMEESVVVFKKDLNLEKDDVSSGGEEEDDDEDTAASLSVSNLSFPHLLGLPYAIQRMLGLPIDRLSPLVGLGNANTASTQSETVDKTRVVYASFQDDKKKKKFGINIPNVPIPPPPEEGAIAHVDMFENLVSDNIDKYYGDKSFSSIVEATKTAMLSSDPFIDGRMSAALGGDNYCEREEDCGGGSGVCHDIPRDTMDYFMASPMRLVFTILIDENNQERVMSIGDMALLAIWVKVKILKIAWNSPAINVSNNAFLSGTLCSQLLLTDLSNFGIMGDPKILNKYDCNSNTLHRGGIKPPTEAEQLNFIKNTSLQNKKIAASLHGHVNARTRTHIGRVTSASWALEALCTITKGSSELFNELANNFDIFHLGHTNQANMIPYYSKNYKSNEKENGLWGYIKRTSEKAAQESGKCITPVEYQIANDLGESLAVLDVVAKRRFISCIDSSSKFVNKGRAKIKEKALLKALGEGDHIATAEESSGKSMRLKYLWRYPNLVPGLLNGENVSVVCAQTGFLNLAVRDPGMINYEFIKENNSVKMKLRLLGPPPSDTDNGGCEQQKQKQSVRDIRLDESTKRKLSDNVVVNTSSKITKYNKMGLTESKEVRDKLAEKDKQSRIASGIRKVISRAGDSSNDIVSPEELVKRANKLAFSFLYQT